MEGITISSCRGLARGETKFGGANVTQGLGGVVENRQDKIGWPHTMRLLYDLGIPTAETLATDTEPWKQKGRVSIKLQSRSSPRGR